jgi:hypothetical protein
MTITIFLASSAYLIFHLYLISKGQTLIEFRESGRNPTLVFKGKSPYDIGVKRNFEQVFGSNELLWLIPICKYTRVS